MHATNARAFSIIPLTVHSPSFGHTSSPPASARGSNSQPQSTTGLIVDSSVNRSSPDPAAVVAGSIEHHQPSPPMQPSRPHTSSSGARKNSSEGVNVNARLFRAMTGNLDGGRRRRADGTSSAAHGHVVNLVHVRSRSLSHSQIGPEAGDIGVGDERPAAILRSSPLHTEEAESTPPGTVLSFPPVSTLEETPRPEKQGAERNIHSSGSAGTVKGKFVRRHHSGVERASTAGLQSIPSSAEMADADS